MPPTQQPPLPPQNTHTSHPSFPLQLLEATHLGGFRIDATLGNRLMGALLDLQCLDHADR
jgi:hypothetical protein